jgi:hypothetical protein
MVLKIVKVSEVMMQQNIKVNVHINKRAKGIIVLNFI